MNIDALDVSDRIKRALHAWGISTVEQICSLTVAELDRVGDLGRRGQERLIAAVLRAGYPGPAIYIKRVLVKPRVRVPMGRALA
jgi:hypothetical protein